MAPPPTTISACNKRPVRTARRSTPGRLSQNRRKIVSVHDSHRAELRAGAFHPGQTPGSGDFLLAQNHGRRRERLQTTARSPPMAPRRGSCGHSMPIVPAAGGAFSPTRFSLTGAAFSLTGAAFGFGGHPRRFLRRAAKRKTHYVIMPKICEKGDNMLLRRIRRCIRI